MNERCLAIIGGSGALGRGLAQRALRHGLEVCIGSRTAERANAVADELRAQIPAARVSGQTNLDAARLGDMVALTVPFASQLAILREIKPVVRGKILIDATVPLMPPKVARVQLPAEDSAAVRAQRELGEEIHVVSALHTTSAAVLGSTANASALGDILVFGDYKASRDAVVSLLASIDLHALHGGALTNSTAAEALTSVLIFMNKTYGAEHAGLRITGLKR